MWLSDRIRLSLALVLLAILGILAYLWDFRWQWQYPFLSSTIVGFSVVLLTVLGLDASLALNERSRWRQARSSILSEIDRSLNSILQVVGSLFGIDDPLPRIFATDNAGADPPVARAQQILAQHYQDDFMSLADQLPAVLGEHDLPTWEWAYQRIGAAATEFRGALLLVPPVGWTPQLAQAVADLQGPLAAFLQTRDIFPFGPDPALEQQLLSASTRDRFVLSALQRVVPHILDLKGALARSL